MKFTDKLKALRGNKSITSLARELNIDRSYLNKIESGYQKPSKRLVQKLIQYFLLSDEDAQALSASVGHKEEGMNHIKPNPDNTTHQDLRKEVNIQPDKLKNDLQEQIEVNVPDNITILYSDSAYLTVNPYGVVFDFAQTLASTNKQKVVARIGVSIQHAKALSKLLQEKIKQFEEMEQLQMRTKES